MTRSIVDFPDPLSPTIATDSPSATCRLTPRSACSPTRRRPDLTRNVFATSCTRAATAGSAAAADAGRPAGAAGTSAAASSSVVIREAGGAGANAAATSPGGRMQALRCPGATSTGSGIVTEHSSRASAQRGSNGQPGGGPAGSGTSPGRVTSGRPRSDDRDSRERVSAAL